MKRQYKYLVTAIYNHFPTVSRVYVYAESKRKAREHVYNRFPGDYSIIEVVRVNVTAPELFRNAFLLIDN